MGQLLETSADEIAKQIVDVVFNDLKSDAERAKVLSKIKQAWQAKIDAQIEEEKRRSEDKITSLQVIREVI